MSHTGPLSGVYPDNEWPESVAGSSPDYEAAARGVWERNNDGNWFQHKQLRTGSYLKAKHDAIAAVDAAFPGLFEERP